MIEAPPQMFTLDHSCDSTSFKQYESLIAKSEKKGNNRDIDEIDDLNDFRVNLNPLLDQKGDLKTEEMKDPVS